MLGTQGPGWVVPPGMAAHGPGPAPRNDGRHGRGCEKPRNDPVSAEIWCSTPRYGYRAGGAIDLHVHSTRRVLEIEIYREGAMPEIVCRRDGIPATAVATPAPPAAHRG